MRCRGHLSMAKMGGKSSGTGNAQQGIGAGMQSAKDFLDEVFNRVDRGKEDDEIKTEGDLMLDYIADKPWRANKQKHLPITYRPSKDSWKERFRQPEDDTIYLYAQPEFKPISKSRRVDEVWNWPWMWTKTKAERLAWIHKYFYVECESLSVQEHMELDAFFSEFDMPTRWGLVRMKELDVLNALALNIAFWTDFNGIKPTDLGLRPDGSVRACPVQFQTCISSSNNPTDSNHYAPPLKWDRAKSPDQAYDEIKRIYKDYPKRGLKWSSGWIDRGGWDPQQFGGPYFYAQANSLAWHFTDDIEFKLDVSKREVQYRSSTRLGIADWDVERLRYNQFVRMLDKKGGWEVQELPRLNWFARTPFRWTQISLDKLATSAENTANEVAMVALPDIANGDRTDAARKAFTELRAYISPIIDPLESGVNEVFNKVLEDPRIAALRQTVDDWEAQLESGAELTKVQTEEWIQKALDLIPENLRVYSPLIDSKAKAYTTPSAPVDSNTLDSGEDIKSSRNGLIVDEKSEKDTVKEWSKIEEKGNDVPSGRISEMNSVEAILEDDIFSSAGKSNTQGQGQGQRKKDKQVLANGEVKVLKTQLRALKKQYATNYQKP